MSHAQHVSLLSCLSLCLHPLASPLSSLHLSVLALSLSLSVSVVCLSVSLLSLLFSLLERDFIDFYFFSVTFAVEVYLIPLALDFFFFFLASISNLLILYGVL